MKDNHWWMHQDYICVECNSKDTKFMPIDEMWAGEPYCVNCGSFSVRVKPFNCHACENNNTNICTTCTVSKPYDGCDCEPDTIEKCDYCQGSKFEINKTLKKLINQIENIAKDIKKSTK